MFESLRNLVYSSHCEGCWSDMNNFNLYLQVYYGEQYIIMENINLSSFI